MNRSTESERLLLLARRRPALSRADVAAAGIHTQVLTRLVQAGLLERMARGQYRLPSKPLTAHHGLAIVSGGVPRAVICLLSALSFHEIGTQTPHQVWIAIDTRSRRPALRYPPLRVFRSSGPALDEGIEVHEIEGQRVRIYCAAKTVVDTFKYRNKVGLDVALEALREALRMRCVKMVDLDRFARICRVENVMRPYLEALVS
jgi:predicted transcriptional regulator of viral defense system